MSCVNLFVCLAVVVVVFFFIHENGFCALTQLARAIKMGVVSRTAELNRMNGQNQQNSRQKKQKQDDKFIQVV